MKSGTRDAYDSQSCSNFFEYTDLFSWMAELSDLRNRRRRVSDQK
jgi:hypothetical protein